jgi:hypothetical protein
MSAEQIARDAAELAMRLMPLAVQGVGPMRDDESQGQYMERVRGLAIDLWIESGPKAELTRRLAELMDSQVFVGILTAVEIEYSSTRAMLTLTVTKDGESVDEMIRTDRTDGPAGRALWETAKGLIRHRVAIYKHMETRADPNKKYRCAKHIVDLGIADDAAEDFTVAAPARPAPGPVAAAPVPAPTIQSTSPRVITQRRQSSSLADSRNEVMTVLERAGHSDPGYREAASAGIMDRASVNGEEVTNLDVLLHLARTTPPADSAAGRMISQRYGRQRERLSA